jgi:iron complex outermembrane recepter protein
MVNYFNRGTEIDTFNTERVEFSRGPNAVLFGLGQAGGAFNVGTKKADLRRNRYATSIRVGDYDALRLTTDLNQTLIKDKLGVRINAAKDNKESWRPNEFKDQQRLDITTRWKVTPKTDLNLEYEIGHIDSSVQRMWGTFDSWTLWNALGRPLDTVAGAGVSPGTTNIGGNYYVYDSTNRRVVNLMNQSRSIQTPAPGTTDSTPTANPMLTDFSIVPKRATLGGKGVGLAQDVSVFTAILQHEVVKDFFVEAAYNKSETVVMGRDIGNTELRVSWDTSPTLPTGTGIPANTRNPNTGQPYVEGLMMGRNRVEDGDNVRVTGSYEIGTGKLQKFLGKHRIAALWQRDESRTRNNGTNERIIENPLNVQTPENANNTFRRRTYVDLNGPIENIAIADFRQNPIVGVIDASRGVPITTAMVPANASDDTRVVVSQMIVAQSRFLAERLVTTFGYRRDQATTYRGTTLRAPGFGPFQQGFLYAAPGDVGVDQEGRTQISGGVVHVTRWLSAFYNQSRSFATASLNNRIALRDPAPSPTGVGRDYGLKLSLLGGKLFATATYYETSARRDNAALNAQFSSSNLNLIWEALEANGTLARNNIRIDDVRTDLNAFTFDSDSEGYEFELVANPTSGWRVSFNFADTKTVQTNTAKELLDYVDKYRALWTANANLTAGTQTIGQLLGTFDDDALNRFIRPEGALKMGDSRYSANLRTNYTVREGRLRGVGAGAGLRWRGEPVLGYTSADPKTRKAIMGRETFLVDANLAYRFNRQVFGRRVDVDVQLNVNNLFNEDDLVPTRLFDNGQIRTYRFQQPRDVFVTTTFRF